MPQDSCGHATSFLAVTATLLHGIANKWAEPLYSSLSFSAYDHRQIILALREKRKFFTFLATALNINCGLQGDLKSVNFRKLLQSIIPFPNPFFVTNPAPPPSKSVLQNLLPLPARRSSKNRHIGRGYA